MVTDELLCVGQRRLVGKEKGQYLILVWTGRIFLLVQCYGDWQISNMKMMNLCERSGNISGRLGAPTDHGP